MPNHVYNIISVEEKYAEKLEEISKVGLCRYYKPMPAILENTTAPAPKTMPAAEYNNLIDKYGAADWYTWCNNNWGTKWGCYDAEYEDGVYKFHTAWSPVSNSIIELLLEDIPDLIYEWEEEQGFGAEMEYIQKKLLNYNEWDIPYWSFDVQLNHPTIPNMGGTITYLENEYKGQNGIYKAGWYADYELEEYLADNQEEATKLYKKIWIKYQN